MKFCKVCQNMYYYGLNPNDPNKLLLYCRHCGDQMEDPSICVSTTQLNNDKKYLNIINQFTKLDPTLPRTDKIDCPNTSCETHKTDFKGKKEIIYERYDDINIKYIYLCAICDTTWKSFEA